MKQEQDVDQLEPSPPASPPSALPPPPQAQPSRSEARSPLVQNASDGPAPPPSLIRPVPPSKRRRVTISGGAQPLNALNTSNLPPSTTNSTPISPVVVGFTIQRDDPAAIEQVRAMLSVKQKQKALIESRRGSLVGGALPPGDSRNKDPSVGMQGGQKQETKKDGVTDAPMVPSVNVLNPTPTSAVPPSPNTSRSPPQRLAPSPSQQLLGPGSVGQPSSSPKNRLSNGLKASNATGNGSGVNTRPHSPSIAMVPGQSSRTAAGGAPVNRSPPSQSLRHSPNNSSQATHIASQGLAALASALPPPPSSFTRRREGSSSGRGNKPADIVINPREGVRLSGLHSAAKTGLQSTSGQQAGQAVNASVVALAQYKAMQPAIQSAPAIARPGQVPGRFPSSAMSTMATPSVPPLLSQRSPSIRRTAGQVPPTPTRLSMQTAQASRESASVRLSQPTGAPPSSNLTAHSTMPATPATIHHARSGSGGYTPAAKSAFLAPFEQFFDALSDARVLKDWFGEQLNRVAKVAREMEMQRADLERTRNEMEKQREDLMRMGQSGAHLTPELEGIVRNAVHREVSILSDEVSWLRSRIHELEDELRARDSPNSFAVKHGSAPIARGVNGMARPVSHSRGGSSGHAASFKTSSGIDSYTFPPVHSPMNNLTLPPPPAASRQSISPAPSNSGPPQDGDYPSREHLDVHRTSSVSRSEASSPAPSPSFGAGRMSVSATRYEPHTPQPRIADRSETASPSKQTEADSSPSARPAPRRHNSNQGSISKVSESPVRGHRKTKSSIPISPPSRPSSSANAG